MTAAREINFISHVCGFTGWPFPQHSVEYDNKIDGEVRLLLLHRFGLQWDSNLFEQVDVGYYVDENELCSAGDYLIRDLVQRDETIRGGGKSAFIDAISNSLSDYSMLDLNTESEFNTHKLRSSCIETAGRVLKFYYQHTLDAVDELLTTHSISDPVLKSVFHLFPSLLYCLASLAVSLRRSCATVVLAIKHYRDFVQPSLPRHSIELELLRSDYHPLSGFSFSVSFGGEKMLVAKPRSSAPLTLLYTIYLKVLQSSKLFKQSDFDDLRASKVFDYSGVSITPFVKHKRYFSDDEIEAYYIAAGILIACSYILDVTDLHYENVIASNIPVPIDVESIFYSETSGTDQIARGGLLASGLLPFSTPFTDIDPFDLSAFGCVRPHRTPLPISGKSFMRDSSDFLTVSPSTNIVHRPDGSIATVKEFSKFITEGFRRASVIISNRTDDFLCDVHRTLESQLLARLYPEPSSVYSYIASTLAEPLFLSNGLARRAAAVAILGRKTRKTPFMPNEEEELLVLGIPRCTIDLVGMHGAIADAFENRCRSLGTVDMKRNISTLKKACRKSLFS